MSSHRGVQINNSTRIKNKGKTRSWFTRSTHLHHLEFIMLLLLMLNIQGYKNLFLYTRVIHQILFHLNQSIMFLLSMALALEVVQRSLLRKYLRQKVAVIASAAEHGDYPWVSISEHVLGKSMNVILRMGSSILVVLLVPHRSSFIIILRKANKHNIHERCSHQNNRTRCY